MLFFSFWFSDQILEIQCLDLISLSTSSSLIDATSSGWEARLVPTFSNSILDILKMVNVTIKVRNKPKDNTFTVLLFKRDAPLHSFANIHTYHEFN